MREYIKKEDALKAISDCGRADYWDTDHIFRSEAEDRIEATPSVDMSEQKTGEWLPFEYGDDTWHKCSVCGVADRYVEVCQRPDGTIGRTAYVRHFCPNCGAKMKSGDDE